MAMTSMVWRQLLSEREGGSLLYKFLVARDLLAHATPVCRAWSQLRAFAKLWADLCERDFPYVFDAFSIHLGWGPGPDSGTEWYDCYRRLARSGLQNGICCSGCRQDLTIDLINLYAHLMKESCAIMADGRVTLQMLPAAERVTKLYHKEGLPRLLPTEVCQKIAHSTCQDFVAFRDGQLLLGPEADGATLRLEDFLDYWFQFLAGSNFPSKWAEIARELRPWSVTATHNLIRILCGSEGTCHVGEPPQEAMQRLQEMISRPEA